MKEYQVHVAFISANGVIFRPGIYSETEIDVAEARRRSYITLIRSGKSSKVEANTKKIDKDNKGDDKVKEVKIVADNPKEDNIDLKTVEATVIDEPLLKFKVNYANLQEFIDLKYVGKKTGEKAIRERKTKYFTDYQDLNARVPLHGTNHWEDVTLIDFESPKKIDEAYLNTEVVDTGSSEAARKSREGKNKDDIQKSTKQ